MVLILFWYKPLQVKFSSNNFNLRTKSPNLLEHVSTVQISMFNTHIDKKYMSGSALKAKIKVLWLLTSSKEIKIKMRSWIRFGICNCILLNNYCFDLNRLNWAFFILIYTSIARFPFFPCFYFFSYILVLVISAKVRLAFYFYWNMLSCIVVFLAL